MKKKMPDWLRMIGYVIAYFVVGGAIMLFLGSIAITPVPLAVVVFFYLMYKANERR